MHARLMSSKPCKRPWRRGFQLDTLLLIPERAAASVDEHERIVAALRRHDVDGAAEQLRQNIENARSAMLARLPSLGIGTSRTGLDL